MCLKYNFTVTPKITNLTYHGRFCCVCGVYNIGRESQLYLCGFKDYKTPMLVKSLKGNNPLHPSMLLFSEYCIIY